MDQLATAVEAAYDTMIGVALAALAVAGCITKAPCGGDLAGRSPVDRGQQGRKRSTVVEGNGIPQGMVVAPAGRHDAPLLEPTLDCRERFTPFAAPPTVHLDRGYDSPLAAWGRWVIARTHAWTNAHKQLVWCTERRERVIRFWRTFSALRVTVGLLVREGWTRSRWDDRPARKP